VIGLSNVDVVETARKLKAHGISPAFIVPTETGLEKAIMDATQLVRERLAEWRIHDFETQAHGTENKKIVQTLVIGRSGIRAEVPCSLYRPTTKSGDPRIWFSKLKQDASSGDLLAICPNQDGTLVVINCSVIDLDKLLLEGVIQIGGAPAGLFDRTSLVVSMNQQNPYLEDLSEKLREVCARSFIRTMRANDTGVGYTLETLLGIAANSSRRPDFHGLEIKSARSRTKLRGQTTLFSKTPDWERSRLKGSFGILAGRGVYSESKKRIQVIHEIGALKPNSYGMQLVVREADDRLDQITVLEERKEFDVTWALSVLKQCMADKHGETVWVTAESRGRGESEEFWYNEASYTSGPDLTMFPLLLDSGAITVHYTIKEKPNGGVKDQGYLFKMAAKHSSTLFNTITPISLVT
jgi:hypothetical protein